VRFRVVVAVALRRGFQLTQYDISNAFLNGKWRERTLHGMASLVTHIKEKGKV
jgi:hypothetical protein